MPARLLRAYTEKTPTSARLYERARGLFPSGVTHYGRYLEPHPLFVARAAGSRKWDVDGNEYIDYFGGHGALMLGHNHPAVVEAVGQQLCRGSHYGASHELELEWAEQIRRMVPCAARVRFTSSGTESTMLALRVARAFTGKRMIARLGGHFHGWHDQAAFPWGGVEVPAGILPGIVESTLLCPPDDFAPLRAICESRDDIAAVILEPTGASFGQIPLPRGYLAQLRELTARRGIVLIFDEVITGFRCSPGGAQAYYKVTPDLAVLAKIVAGGFPGAALAGSAGILETLAFRETAEGIRPPAVPHQGTFNAAPVSAAAGLAALRIIAGGEAIERANHTAAAIRDGMNDVLGGRGIGWCVYGEFSGFHIFPNRGPEVVTPEDIYAGKIDWRKLKGATPIALQQKIRAGMLLEGVDLIGWPGGLTSSVHTGEDVDRTLSAFEKVIDMLAEEGDL